MLYHAIISFSESSVDINHVCTHADGGLTERDILLIFVSSRQQPYIVELFAKFLITALNAHHDKSVALVFTTHTQFTSVYHSAHPQFAVNSRSHVVHDKITTHVCGVSPLLHVHHINLYPVRVGSTKVKVSSTV